MPDARGVCSKVSATLLALIAEAWGSSLADFLSSQMRLLSDRLDGLPHLGCASPLGCSAKNPPSECPFHVTPLSSAANPNRNRNSHAPAVVRSPILRWSCWS